MIYFINVEERGMTDLHRVRCLPGQKDNKGNDLDPSLNVQCPIKNRLQSLPGQKFSWPGDVLLRHTANGNKYYQLEVGIPDNEFKRYEEDSTSKTD